MTRQGYINQQKILQNRLARKYLKPVFDSIMGQTNQYIAILEAQGMQKAYSTVHGMMAINTTIGPVIKALYRDAYRLATPKTVINKTIKRVLPISDALTYLDDHLLEKVVTPISETTKKRFLDELKRGINSGQGFDKTVAKLCDTGMNRRRAIMIVRTESVRALNFSQLKAAADERYQVLKTWIAVEDARTRHSHREVDGQTILWEDEFTNGCFYPGDPNAPPSETISCRCTLGYKYAKGDDGKPLPKYQSFQGQATGV
jgi:SPP1 gp7 family putative phage head morphogenesis protein